MGNYRTVFPPDFPLFWATNTILATGPSTDPATRALPVALHAGSQGINQQPRGGRLGCYMGAYETAMLLHIIT